MGRRATTQQAHYEHVRDVLVHVREHLNGRLSLRDLARVACMSPYHFVRVFERMTGRGPGEHVRSVRLVRAAVALRTTLRPVVRVGLDAGYANHESFSRAFREEFGVSPTEYRAGGGNDGRNGETRRTAMKFSVGLVKVPVTDFARACAYYRDVVGLREEFAVEEYGWAQYETGGVSMCLYVVGRGGGEGQVGGERDFHLRVSDAKAAYEAIAARGGKFACGLVPSDDGSVFFVLEDPDGNRIKVGQGT